MTAAKAYLVEKMEWDESRVIITVIDPRDVPRLAASSDVVIRIMGESPRTEIIDGSGRYDNRRTRRLKIACRSRLMLDLTGQDEQRIVHESLSHIVLEDAVLNALELQWQDSALQALTSPWRLGHLSDPERLKDDDTWVLSAFDAEFDYTRDLDLTIWP